MNKKLAELARQAWIEPTYIDCNGKECKHSADDVPPYFSKEVFAEFIVRECAKFLEENSGYDDCNNAWHPEPEDLLKHFGFE